MILALGILADVGTALVAAVFCFLVFCFLRSIVLLALDWIDYQRAIGYDYGLTDGYKRGKDDAELLRALAAPAGPDSFTEALLSGALREPVGEEMASLLGAIQEHERAARAEATR